MTLAASSPPMSLATPPVPVLPATIVSVSVAVPRLSRKSRLEKPPPETAAVLPLIVQAVRNAVPALLTPPPEAEARVAADRAVREHRAGVVIQAAAEIGGVAAERASRQRRLGDGTGDQAAAGLAELPLIVQPVSVAVAWLYTPPPTVSGGVAADRAAGQRQRGTAVIQAAADVPGGVAADRAAGERRRAGGPQAATLDGGGVAADRAVVERQRPLASRPPPYPAELPLMCSR